MPQHLQTQAIGINVMLLVNYWCYLPKYKPSQVHSVDLLSDMPETPPKSPTGQEMAGKEHGFRHLIDFDAQVILMEQVC